VRRISEVRRTLLTPAWCSQGAGSWVQSLPLPLTHNYAQGDYGGRFTNGTVCFRNREDE